MSSRELHWRIGNQNVSCRIDESSGHGTFYIENSALPFRIVDSTHIEISGKRHRFRVIHSRDSSTVWLDGRTYYLQPAKSAIETQATGNPGTGEVRALMPGKLVRLAAGVGDMVEEKQTVAIMESMKMETALVAPTSGQVTEVRFKAGQVVDMGEIVMVIEEG